MTQMGSEAVREMFVEVPVRDRFYQSSSFFPLPVVLISTRTPDGATNLAPYSLLFPDPDPKRHTLHLLCRAGSNTAANIEAGSGVTICFVPDEPLFLQNIKRLGTPGPSDEKMSHSVFHLLASESSETNGQPMPDCVEEAIQVFECRLSDDQERLEIGSDSRHFPLNIERILLRPSWRSALDDGNAVPRLPIDFGFRDPTSSWLSRPHSHSTRPRMRPRFETIVALPPEVVMARFEASVGDRSTGLEGNRAGNHFVFDFPESERRIGTPQLDLQVHPHDEGTSVRARIGPHPHIWTLFIFFHALIAFAGLASLMVGFAQLTMGRSALIMLGVPGALLLHAFLAGAAYVGQGLAAEQIYQLRSFVEDTLASPG